MLADGFTNDLCVVNVHGFHERFSKGMCVDSRMLLVRESTCNCIRILPELRDLGFTNVTWANTWIHERYSRRMHADSRTIIVRWMRRDRTLYDPSTLLLHQLRVGWRQPPPPSGCLPPWLASQTSFHTHVTRAVISAMLMSSTNSQHTQSRKYSSSLELSNSWLNSFVGAIFRKSAISGSRLSQMTVAQCSL